MVRRLLVGCLLVLSLGLMTASGTAKPNVTEDDKHVLARTLIGEADWSEADWAAISWVLWRRHQARAGEAFGDTVRAYSAVWRADSHRARSIRALPWGPSDEPWGRRLWNQVRAWVERWARGEIRDPCPKATHFGGPMDRPKGPVRVVNCGRTINLFYAEKQP